MYNNKCNKEEFEQDTIKSNIMLTFLMIAIGLLVSMGSCTAIANKTNFLGTDISVWINVAKKIQDGKVIYKDIFDHKGPILYLFYYIAYSLGGIKGLGVLEYISILLDMTCIFNIAKELQCNNKKSMLVAIICMIFFTLLCDGNPCVESIALPFILFVLRKFIKFVKGNDDFQKKDSFLVGMCLGIIMLLKLNLAVLWIVYYLFIAIYLLKEKKISELIKIVIFSLFGLIIVIVPFFIYFVVTNSIGDFWNTYIVFNFKYIGIKEQDLLNTWKYFWEKTYIFITITLITSIVHIFMNKERTLEILNLIYLLATVYLIITPQRNYIHYLIPLISCISIPIALLIRDIKIDNLIYSVIVVVFILIMNKNIKDTILARTYDYEKLCSKIQIHTEDDDNVLIIGNESNLYIASNREYKGKYFYQYPIIFYDEEIEKNFIKEVNEDKPKLIVDISKLLEVEYDSDLEKKFKKDMIDIIENDYEKIAEKTYLRKEK